MRARHIAVAALAFGILGITSVAFAQGDAGPAKEKSFFDRLDSFGKSIVGEIIPQKTKAKDATMPRDASRTSSRTPKMAESSDEVGLPPADSRRAGSILSGSPTAGRMPVDAPSTQGDSGVMPENTPLAVPRAADGTPRPTRRALASLFDDVAEKPAQEEAPVASPRANIAGQTEVIRDRVELPDANVNVLRPLHERLSAVRHSAFGADTVRDSGPPSDLSPARESEEPAAATKTTEAATAKPAALPIIAQRTRPQFSVGETATAEPILNPAAAAKTPAIVAKPAVAAKPADDGVLMTRKGPVLSVETLGPRRISVGKESAYQVNIVNSGEVAAEELVIFISLPEWAEVAGAETSSGAARAGAAGAMAGTVQWNLGHLDAKGRERLSLRIIPRQSRPFDLAVRWEYKPVASQAMIEVQEPKLALQLEGPREVLYGKKEVYRLRLINIGNGSAENVAIMLMPIGGGENVPATHKLGLLSAGEEKVLDVELTARQAGDLSIQVDARADGGVHAELAEKVLVRRAALKVDVEGPKVQFVGATATYNICLRNPGTASARNVNVSVVLPAGTKYLSGIEDARIDAAEGKLAWTIENINPEVEQRFALKCSLGAPGVSRVQVSAAADDDLTTSAGAVTQVDAVANLAMEVKDPAGPVAVGEDANFEVRIRNRGAREAAGVEVFAYFSRGIEPTSAEGSPNRLGPGQVTFLPIPSLAPGAETILKVRARAEVAGNHIFRAEVHCKPLGTRLVREATNLYYTDSSASQQASQEPAADGPPANAMRTVTRPMPGELTPIQPRK